MPQLPPPSFPLLERGINISRVFPSSPLSSPSVDKFFQPQKHKQNLTLKNPNLIQPTSKAKKQRSKMGRWQCCVCKKENESSVKYTRTEDKDYCSCGHFVCPRCLPVVEVEIHPKGKVAGGTANNKNGSNNGTKNGNNNGTSNCNDCSKCSKNCSNNKSTKNDTNNGKNNAGQSGTNNTPQGESSKTGRFYTEYF